MRNHPNRGSICPFQNQQQKCDGGMEWGGELRSVEAILSVRADYRVVHFPSKSFKTLKRRSILVLCVIIFVCMHSSLCEREKHNSERYITLSSINMTLCMSSCAAAKLFSLIKFIMWRQIEMIGFLIPFKQNHSFMWKFNIVYWCTVVLLIMLN